MTAELDEGVVINMPAGEISRVSYINIGCELEDGRDVLMTYMFDKNRPPPGAVVMSIHTDFSDFVARKYCSLEIPFRECELIIENFDKEDTQAKEQWESRDPMELFYGN